MTGEMCESEVTLEAFPLHFAIAKEFNGEVRPFDHYQGPYVFLNGARIWIMPDEGDPAILVVFNECALKSSNSFMLTYDADFDAKQAINLASEVI